MCLQKDESFRERKWCVGETERLVEGRCVRCVEGGRAGGEWREIE